MAGPTDLIKDSVLGSSARDNQQDAFLAYMNSQGLEFSEYANEAAEAETPWCSGKRTYSGA